MRRVMLEKYGRYLRRGLWLVPLALVFLFLPAPEGPRTSIISLLFGSINLRLWYVFFILGLALFLTGLSPLRRPLLFLSVIFLGFYIKGCQDPAGFYYIISGKGLPTVVTGLILLIIPVLISLIWGRVFCGWMCPLGAVQELIHPDRFSIGLPTRLDKGLKHLKSILLVLFSGLNLYFDRNPWCNYCPFRVLFKFKGIPPGICILCLMLPVMLLIERPFCRYLCPLGAVLKYTSGISLFKLAARSEACNNCRSCSRVVCPMNAISATGSGSPVIDEGECIRCFRCTDACRRSALTIDKTTQQQQPSSPSHPA